MIGRPYEKGNVPDKPFPKGNQYWQLIDPKDIGRNLALDPTEVKAKIIDYFKMCINQSKSKGMKPTITGLIYHAGFISRKQFIEYEGREAFSNVIKKARLLIENYYEHMALGAHPAGPIFVLKQFDWTDQVQINSHEVSEVIVTINKGGKTSRIKEGKIIAIDPPTKALGSK